MENKWVSVKDELPEINEVAKYSERVLCFTNTGLMAVGYVLHGNWCRDGSRSSFTESGYTVTHWMPLPEPPTNLEGK